MKKILIFMLVVSICLLTACDAVSENNTSVTLTNSTENINNEKLEIIDIAPGNSFSLYLLNNGIVYYSGMYDVNVIAQKAGITETPEKIQIDKKIKKVFTKYILACLLTEDNEIYYFGYDLINSEIPQNEEDNVEQKFTYPPKKLDFNKSIKDIVVGNKKIFVLTDEGEVYTVGINKPSYDMGIEEDSAKTFVKVNLPEKITKISTGTNATLFLSETNTLYACGELFSAELSLNDGVIAKTPVKIRENIIDISVGMETAYIVDSNNQLYSLGKNSCGEAGVGSDKYIIEKFTKVNIPEKVKNVYSANFFFCIAVTTDGKFYAWGENREGEFDSSKEIIKTPKLLNINIDAKKIIVGDQTYLFTNDNEIYVFGLNLVNEALITDKKVLTEPTKISWDIVTDK